MDESFHPTSWNEEVGVNLPVKDDIAEHDYEWLDVIDESDCYMALDFSDSKSSKSLDFGSGGYTGSLSAWHELLQLTCPDSQCGVVFVRGDFPDNADSILARAQRRNQKGTFGLGLHVPDDQEYVLEMTPAEGYVNLRYPVTRLHCVRQSDLFGSVTFASYTSCSFVKDGTVYQIARILPSHLASSTSSSVHSRPPPKDHKDTEITVDVGGVIRFGCACSSAHRHGIDGRSLGPVVPLFHDRYKTVGNKFVFGCESAVHQKRLEMRLWIDREAQPLEMHPCSSARLDRHLCGQAHPDDESQPENDESYPDEVCRMHVRQRIPFREDRSTVLVAAFRLVDSDQPLDTREMDVIDYRVVQEYLGVADDSLCATYRLWTNTLNCLSGNTGKFEINAIGRAVESTMSIASVPLEVAREDGGRRDLGVALVKNIVASPIVSLESTFWQVRLLVKAANLLGSHPLLDTYDFKKKTYQDMQNAHRATIVGRIRHVCRWLLGLSDRIIEKDGFKKLRDVDVGILVSDVRPAPAERPRCQPRPFLNSNSNITPQEKQPEDEKPGRGSLRSTHLRAQRFYLAMTIWYVLKQLPEVFFHDGDSDAEAMQEYLWEHIPTLASVRNKDNQAHAIASDDAHACFTRWYHSFSVQQLCAFLHRKDEARFTSIDVDVDAIKKQALHWQVKAEKSLRLYSQGRLTEVNLGHEPANLAMLGPELGISGRLLILRSKSCLAEAREQVEARKPTSRLNAGRAVVIRWDPKNKTRSAKPRPAPWELSCLAQHLPISLGLPDAQGKGRDDCLERCNKFLLADFTYSSSWDTSKTTTTGQWWDFVTSSIICAELIDNIAADNVANNKVHPTEGVDTSDDGRDRPDPRLAKLEEVVTQMHQLMVQNMAAKKCGEDSETSSGKQFDWKSFRPKPLFHADTTVQSLEDTPDFYHLKQTQSIKLQTNIIEYLHENAMPANDWSLETIKQAIHASKLHHLSCFDLALMVDRNDLPEISKPFVRGRANTVFWEVWRSKSRQADSAHLLELLRADSPLMDLYLIGKAADHPDFQKLDDEARKLLQDPDLRSDLLDAYQDSLFMVLNDSLADQGTKYRILFAKRLSPATLQAMIFMWHPDAIDTYDAHLGELSQFSDSLNQSITGGEDTWITSITISHWRLHDPLESMILRAENEVDDAERKIRQEKLDATEAGPEATETRRSLVAFRSLPALIRRFTSRNSTRPTNSPKASSEPDMELAAPPTTTTFGTQPKLMPKDLLAKKPANPDHVEKDDFPPQSVADERRGKIHDLRLSLVMTGDSRGRSWTCSMVCELFSEAQAATYALEAAETLQMFIHEQDTGRALVFMLLLGYMCEALAGECDVFIKELDQITGRSAKVLLEGMEWQKSGMALRQLKRMLWGLEALRIFKDKLAKAMDALNDARAKMVERVKKRETIQNKDMRRTVQRFIEEFEKRYGHVKNALGAIQQRIEEGTKLEEGITSVLSVEQNENISMLTWLTIVYLPPAFIVGVFGMGHDIVPTDAGWAAFIWLLAVFIMATIASALSLQFVIERFRALGHWTNRLWTLHPRLGNGGTTLRAWDTGRVGKFFEWTRR
ncbi:hypothetical protein QBC34DRAFT_443388 [Podospora aff. communis PSN243]|uniref:Uncharacterized protein n=1 Tax=Podospora aff. communis PSN243 TaxID=3040156 RepID=A0AAV9G7N7_9PEZI|nr:hypothetical protein QBC34DRAFT_443388 [Podospora aff. communis PSN243]